MTRTSRVTPREIQLNPIGEPFMTLAEIMTITNTLTDLTELPYEHAEYLAEQILSGLKAAHAEGEAKIKSDLETIQRAAKAPTTSEIVKGHYN